ncbi:MAG TPA: hypothetical protein VMQ65_04170 [Candidatus Limnocylindria bacterium]|nr:hypothetical protein [Candidatus Limnocylindria bacterium]
MSEGRRLALCVYRPRDGRAAELEQFLPLEIATLRSRAYITQRGVPVCRTERGDYLAIVEWRTARSVDEAHADPVIVELWDKKQELAEYVGVDGLARADQPFASYEVVGDV